MCGYRDSIKEWDKDFLTIYRHSGCSIKHNAYISTHTHTHIYIYITHTIWLKIWNLWSHYYTCNTEETCYIYFAFFSCNAHAFASEILENLEELLLCY